MPQLNALGLSADGVAKRLAQGTLHRLHRGVYAVGHSVLSADGRFMAAVLACGPGAALSHRSAASALGLLRSARSQIDVIAPHRAGRKRSGIDVHRPGGLLPRDVVTVRAVPCTTVARTLLDLADVLPRRLVERAFDQAEVLQLLDTSAVADVLHRSPGRRGAPTLPAIVAARRDPALTRNELEQRFLALCSAAGLPCPEVNAWIALADQGALEVDFLWRAQRLIVETDGHATHGTRQAFERDRRRDQLLMAAGWRVVRFTWRQVVNKPAEVVRTLVALLAERRPTTA